MPDEKRIKDFEPATELLIDDWFAVDSPSQGTRKIQKSMFMADEIASLQALSTAMGGAQTDIGNLQTRAGMSQNLNFGDNLTDGVNILSVLLGAEPYVNTRTYAVGEYCIYEKQLYKCTTAVSSAEDFDSDKWTLTNVKTELTELNSSLTPFADNGWTCRKNADNSYECYISVDVTASSSSSYGGGLYFHQSNTIPMPSVISSQVIAKIASIQGAQLKMLCGDTISISNHNMTVYYLDATNTSGSSNRCTVGIHLIGK